MAAMLGGTMRAPLTGALFAVELTGDVHALAPLLAATVAAYAVTVLLLKRSILTEKIARRGQHVTREYGLDPYELTRVGAVMTRTVDVFDAEHVDRRRYRGRSRPGRITPTRSSTGRDARSGWSPVAMPCAGRRRAGMAGSASGSGSPMPPWRSFIRRTSSPAPSTS